MPNRKREYAPQEQIDFARKLRAGATDAEVLLWGRLRRRQLNGYRFRRQHPIGPYIADFACVSERLIIELDGGQHAEPHTADERRDLFLRQQGYRVMRFWNHEVSGDCFGVLQRVYEALTDPPPPQPAA